MVDEQQPAAQQLPQPENRNIPGFTQLVDVLASRYRVTGEHRTRLAHLVDFYVNRQEFNLHGMDLMDARRALVTSSLVHALAGDAANARTLSHLEMYLGEPSGGMLGALAEGPGSVPAPESGRQELPRHFFNRSVVPERGAVHARAYDFFRGQPTDGNLRATAQNLAERVRDYTDPDRRRPREMTPLVIPLYMRYSEQQEEDARHGYALELRELHHRNVPVVGREPGERRQQLRDPLFIPLTDAYFRRVLAAAEANGLRVRERSAGLNEAERLDLLQRMVRADRVIQVAQAFAGSEQTRFDVEVIGRYTGGREALMTELRRIADLPEVQRGAAYTTILDSVLRPPANPPARERSGLDDLPTLPAGVQLADAGDTMQIPNRPRSRGPTPPGRGDTQLS